MNTRTILTVTELNRATGQLLADHFYSIWVEGELSNTVHAASGHCYFTLKDAHAQVRCAMFRMQQRKLAFKPENGKQVLVKAQVSLYEPRGDYQLVVETMEAAGQGALQRAFEALKQKLLAEGLFAAEHKQPLPVLPSAIAVITSPKGAAIHDILTVLQRRFAAIPVILYPVAVQGDKAPMEIVRAIALANAQAQCEVIILGRGGGSLEDLWAFNDERVARAVFASAIPIIAAVGHETDVTITDFVADVRAPTPSAAAETASPDMQEWLARYVGFERRLWQLWQRQLNQHQQRLGFVDKRLQQQHPGQKLAGNARRLEALELRLQQVMRAKIRQQHGVLAMHTATLGQFNPALMIKHYQQQQQYLSQRLQAIVLRHLERCQQRLAQSSQTLHTVSPLATLSRGYALVVKPATGQLISRSGQLCVGDSVETRLAEGRFVSQVTGLD